MEHLRPLRVGETVDISARLWVRNLWDLMKIFLVFLIPTTVIRLLVASAVADDALLRDNRLSFTEDSLNLYNTTQAILAIVDALLGLLALGACVFMLGQRYLGRPTTWTQALGAAFSRFWVLLGASILFGLGVMAGTLALIVPGIFLAVSWWLHRAAIMIEREGPAAALRRSYNLVQGRWWPTFGALLVGGIVYAIFAVAIPLAAEYGLMASDSALMFMMLSALITIVGVSISQPLLGALEVVIYFELRVRKEGFDLEMQAQRLGMQPQAPAPPPGPPVFEEPPPEEPPWRRATQDEAQE
jgi:hypothetical protein